ncbi:MAG: hypothetical protein FJX51_12535 [Alphaproteobacteria bacterium]|nr:hypothetical protein [Alphaproteobacteria bacterium]
MDDDAVWTVDEVEPEAREAAKLAARRSGLGLGQWLTATIMAAAAAELKRGARPAANDAHDSQAHARKGANGDGQLPALPVDVLIENIRRLTSRVEEAEKRTAESVLPLAEKMASLSERIEEVGARASATTKPMERALARMAERLEKLEAGGGGDTEKSARRRFSAPA